MSKSYCGVFIGGAAFIGLSSFSILAEQTPALAVCPIPDSVSDQATVVASFLNSECTKQTLTQDTTFYRYYNDDNTYLFGRYLTTNFYDSSDTKTTLDVIRELALAQYFGPPPNLAQLRERVTLPPGLDVYIGTTGPQSPSACYPGGAEQVFVENTRTPGISFVFDGNVPNGGSLPTNCYAVGSSVVGKQVPEPSALFGISAIAATFGLISIFNRGSLESRTRQTANS
ncbi:MAG: hypothetical protein PUP93_02305 [Rhizonema sp. NSF051]|nr:hypothetical protein [Rhizonema sp. NSF051]